jgi:hypothetical protein
VNLAYFNQNIKQDRKCVYNTTNLLDYAGFNHRMANELGRIWKETIVTWLRYYPSVYLAELRKTTTNNQDKYSECTGWDSNTNPLDLAAMRIIGSSLNWFTHLGHPVVQHFVWLAEGPWPNGNYSEVAHLALSHNQIAIFILPCRGSPLFRDSTPLFLSYSFPNRRSLLRVSPVLGKNIRATLMLKFRVHATWLHTAVLCVASSPRRTTRCKKIFYIFHTDWHK